MSDTSERSNFESDVDHSDDDIVSVSDQVSDCCDDADLKSNDDQQDDIPLLSKKKLEKYNKAKDETGVVYMSHVPPYMKPQTVRHMLSKFGKIGRVFFIEEDMSARKTRVKSGGSKKRQYKEGWIEFQSKKTAKVIAGSLNSTPMGGKKTSYYHDDIWHLKYLSGFKWIDLMDQLAYERQERKKRVDVEVRQAKKEVEMYLKNVEKSKMVKAMEEKKRKRSGAEPCVSEETPTTSNNDVGISQNDALMNIRRRFKQRKVVMDSTDCDDSSKLSTKVKVVPKSQKVQSVLNNVSSNVTLCV